MGESNKALYVTGEESPQQVTLRARRLGLAGDGLRLLAETDVETICGQAVRETPQVMVVDSIQTLRVAEASGAPGGVTQIRESAAWLTRYAKQSNCAVFLVGHVTKSGEVAGPRVLEHIVDTVLYLEGRNDDRYRMLRATKNRFGAINELGVFAMTEQGMREVRNPSAIFLNRRGEPTPGSAVLVVWDGSRPLLLEIQALLDASSFGSPRRVAVGLDGNRLAMLLAVLHRHGGIQASDQDVFVNVVGGVRVTETGADLALLLAMVSSLRDRPLDPPGPERPGAAAGGRQARLQARHRATRQRAQGRRRGHGSGQRHALDRGARRAGLTGSLEGRASARRERSSFRGRASARRERSSFR
jgi:DNA repair protein RadA/Sms